MTNLQLVTSSLKLSSLFSASFVLSSKKVPFMRRFPYSFILFSFSSPIPQIFSGSGFRELPSFDFPRLIAVCVSVDQLACRSRLQLLVLSNLPFNFLSSLPLLFSVLVQSSDLPSYMSQPFFMLKTSMKFLCLTSMKFFSEIYTNFEIKNHL